MLLRYFIFLWLIGSMAWAQSPHGEFLIVDCAECHNPNGWDVSPEEVKFDHNSTRFELTGAHNQVDCRTCHSTLVFEDAPSDCMSCHQDIHSQTVGNDCARCHTSTSWLVDEIPELHESNGFPLSGAHANLSCVECHQSETNLRFDRLGNECLNCHLDNYQQTTQPNHQQAGYSTDCLECHSPLAFGWNAEVVSHDFFPLTLGHDIQDCAQCHNVNDFSAITPDCIACHAQDFASATNPNHQQLQFSNDCAACHTTDPDWRPATFDHDGLFFPIYSGSHQGEWNECVDCHTNPGDFSVVSCTNCHKDPETSNEHNGITGYAYVSSACLACHPTGEEDGFNHNSTGFPLTKGHAGVDCIECHANGFQGTSPECESCHMPDFQSASNPNHQALAFSNDCASCHTTDPGWAPATFADHNSVYPLNGAHNNASCVECHKGNYNNTPNTCVGCHLSDYNGATNPNHAQAQFPNDCATCHSESAWSPSTFDHDGEYFPIYSGKHNNEWNTCSECHNNPGNYAVFTCLTCHKKTSTDNDHKGVNGYSYVSTACLQCHPNGN